jgi:hypothetical protein
MLSARQSTFIQYYKRQCLPLEAEIQRGNAAGTYRTLGEDLGRRGHVLSSHQRHHRRQERDGEPKDGPHVGRGWHTGKRRKLPSVNEIWIQGETLHSTQGHGSGWEKAHLKTEQATAHAMWQTAEVQGQALLCTACLQVHRWCQCEDWGGQDALLVWGAEMQQCCRQREGG